MKDDDSTLSKAIPIVDIRSSNPDAPKQLLDAAARYGFVFIDNNDESGVDPADIAHMFQLSQTFFSSPLAVKEAVSISSNQAGKNHGWLGRGVEKLDPATQKRPDVKEAFNIGEPLNNHTLQQPLPFPLVPHLATLINFQLQCQHLCHTLLEHFATALAIDRTWFTTRHDPAKGPSGTVFRMLYYPRIPTTDDEYEDGIDIRAGAHSDFGSLTLLFQQAGQPGLEIKTPTGEWAAVPVDPRNCSPQPVKDEDRDERPLPILVNIGDLLEDWTAGLLKSTVHRVIFPHGGRGSGEDRYSMAYFCHPLDDAELEAVPSEIVQQRRCARVVGQEPAKCGRVVTAKEHLMRRLAATYTVK